LIILDGLIGSMGITVNFDDNFLCRAIEIDNVWSNTMLTPKL